MDFSNFDPSETVLVQVQACDEDDPQSAPFIDENPCLVCGHKAFANFIDLSFGTSCTTQTGVPVKKKLKEILRRVWDLKKDNQILCLACYDLVDRYDSLESQLNTIRENIEEKFQKTYVRRVGKVKAAAAAKRKGRQPSKTKKTQKKKTEIQILQDDDDADGGFADGIAPDDNFDSDFSPNDENVDIKPPPDELQNVQCLQPVQQFAPVEQQPELPNPNVYDEHHQLLQRGEKIRLGKAVKDVNGIESLVCAYCPQAWADISSLHTHVHAIHQPEVVDVAIPPELGLGNTMNCGVEIQNCQEPPEAPKPWSCLYCDASFRARTNMSSHFKEKHTPYKPFSCSDCGDAFRKGIDLNRHKLYFCSQRTIMFAPKRKYKKRDMKAEKVPPKKKKGDDDDYCENN